MKKPDLVRLYEVCFPAVQNEMFMRKFATQLNGRFIRDDFVTGGKLRSVAWVLMNKEETVLHFPETYGRRVVVEMRDIWNNVLAEWTQPGYYYLNIPGVAMARLVAEIDVGGASEQEYMIALDLQDDLTITDVAIGGNEYEDSYRVVNPVTPIPPRDVAELGAGEFFSIASVIERFNPPKDPSIRPGLSYTEEATAPELEAAKIKALKKMNISY